MSGKVEFYRHQLGDEEAASWRRALDTLFLTLGPQVAAFEQELGRFLVRGREHEEAPRVVGTSSCSMGLLLTLRALDVGPGDEVITTPMTFAATASAVLHLGAKPKLVDVEPTTGLIDPAAVRAAIGPSSVGILPVASLRPAGRHEGLAGDRRPIRPFHRRGRGPRHRDGARRGAPGRAFRSRGLLVLRDEESHERRRRRGSRRGMRMSRSGWAGCAITA